MQFSRFVTATKTCPSDDVCVANIFKICSWMFEQVHGSYQKLL